MKRKKKILIIAIIVTLLFTAFFISKIKGIEEIETSSVNASQEQFKSNNEEYLEITDEINEENDEESIYEEGKAIIVYKSNNFFTKLKVNTMSLFDDYKVEDTIEFGKLEIDSISNSNESEKNEISVSIVSSDEYSTEKLIEKLNEKDWVISAIPNYEFETLGLTNDEYADDQWAIQNNGDFGGTAGNDIRPITTSSEEEKVVVIVDTGVDYTNDDLVNAMWRNPFDESILPGTYGYDFVNDDDDPMDDNGHGTHCAGIIAAEPNNGVGISGAVVGATNVKIMALKVGNANGSMSLNNILNAYNYILQAQELGVNIVAINNSWGVTWELGTDLDDSIQQVKELFDEVVQQVGENGAISVFASGNNGLKLDESGVYNSGRKSYLAFPACLENDYEITVAAIDSNDELGYFSNYGEAVDIAAPGVDIYSTYKEDYTFNPVSSKKDEYCLYEDFEGESSYVIDNIKPYIVTSDARTDASSICSMEVTDERFFGDSGKALKISVDNSNSNKEIDLRFSLSELGITDFDTYAISLDLYVVREDTIGGRYIDAGYGYSYTGKCLTALQNENADAFADLGVSKICELTDYWHRWSGVYLQKKYQTLEYLDVVMYNLQKGQYTIYIDNLVITNDLGDDYNKVFTSYKLKSGTSMAAPYVTASVAVACNQYEDYSIKEIKNLILNGTRNQEEFSGKSKYGALDMQAFLRPQEMGLIYSDSYYNYDGEEHSISLSVMKPTNGVNIYYSTEQELTSENYLIGDIEKPTFTEAGEYTVYWYAHSADGTFEDASGNSKVYIKPAWLSLVLDNKYANREITGGTYAGMYLIQLQLDNTCYTYNGSEIDAIGELIFKGKALIEGKDYVVKYYISSYDENNYPKYDDEAKPIDANNVYFAGITGIGNFTGELSTVEFTIEPRNITITANDQKILEGSQIKTGVEVITVGENGLADGQLISEITIESAQEENNQEVIKASNVIIKDSSNNDVTSNYNITYVDGKLTTYSIDEIVEVQFNDIGLYKSIILGNGIETLYEDEENQKAIFEKNLVEQLEELVLNDNYGKITDLTGLDSFYNLRSLDVQNSELENVQILENLTKLEKLNLKNTRVKDIGKILELPNIAEVKVDTSCNIEELENDENKMYLPQFLQSTSQTQDNAVITAYIRYGEDNETEIAISEDDDGKLYVILDNKVSGSKPAGDRIVYFNVSGGVTNDSKISVLYTVEAPLTNFETIRIEEEEYIVISIEDNNSVNSILTRDNFPNTNYEMRAIDINDKTLIDNDKIGTGTKIELLSGQEVIKTYNISVKGDIDSDGFVDLYDILRLIDLVFDSDLSYEWNEAVRLAGKCAENSNTTNPDIYDILRVIEYHFDNMKF